MVFKKLGIDKAGDQTAFSVMGELFVASKADGVCKCKNSSASELSKCDGKKFTAYGYAHAKSSVTITLEHQAKGVLSIDVDTDMGVQDQINLARQADKAIKSFGDWYCGPECFFEFEEDSVVSNMYFVPSNLRYQLLATLTFLPNIISLESNI